VCSFLIVVVGVVAVHVFFLGFAWVAGLVVLCWFGVAFWLCCWSQADVQEDVEVLLGEFVSGGLANTLIMNMDSKTTFCY